jgi:diacylglycerol kinase family enzyme
MKTLALYNSASGSVTTDGELRLREALEASGVRGAELIELDRADCKAQLKALADARPDLFVVWGGDGTLRVALSVVGRATPNLLLLPGGTMNMLTRSIHGDRPWDEVLRDVMASPKRRKLPAGAVNDEQFFCAMLAGAPARFAEARESLRRGELVKAAAEARAAIETIGALHLEASYRDGYSFRDARLPSTSVIAVLVGALARDSAMEIAALAQPSTAAALNVVWASFLSDWRSAPGVTAVPARSLVIESGDGRAIPVIVDGESIEAGDVVRVNYVEDAVQCLTAG